jgi:carboxyl-terminal processing protease
MKKSHVVAVALIALGIPTAVVLGAPSDGPSPKDLALLNGVIQLVERAYVHPIGADELTKDALKGMLSRLDPHSDYMDEQEFREARADIAGEFGGLGLQISGEGGVPKVISPIDGTPAARAGLQPGDLIVSVDGKSTQGTSLDVIVRSLRGKPGTTVKVTISRGTEAPFDVTLTRSIIQVQSVKAKLAAPGIGYVRISEFGSNTADDVRKAIGDVQRQAAGDLKGLVLDLRNDPGGLLDSAVAIGGTFLDGGTIVSIRGRDASDSETFNAPTGAAILPKVPMVVLINGGSASASEIVAGALQDRHRATIMGTTSFGKGSVQTLIPLKGYGAVRLTTALYYTPNGRSIQGQGVSPDIVVEASKDTQVAGAVMLREKALRGALANPGALSAPARSGGPTQSSERTGSADEASLTPPIKTELIGTRQDSQLDEAVSYLQRGVASTSGRG